MNINSLKRTCYNNFLKKLYNFGFNVEGEKEGEKIIENLKISYLIDGDNLLIQVYCMICGYQKDFLVNKNTTYSDIKTSNKNLLEYQAMLRVFQGKFASHNCSISRNRTEMNKFLNILESMGYRINNIEESEKKQYKYKINIECKKCKRKMSILSNNILVYTTNGKIDKKKIEKRLNCYGCFRINLIKERLEKMKKLIEEHGYELCEDTEKLIINSFNSSKEFTSDVNLTKFGAKLKAKCKRCGNIITRNSLITLTKRIISTKCRCFGESDEGISKKSLFEKIAGVGEYGDFSIETEIKYRSGDGVEIPIYNLTCRKCGIRIRGTLGLAYSTLKYYRILEKNGKCPCGFTPEEKLEIRNLTFSNGISIVGRALNIHDTIRGRIRNKK